MLSRALLTPLLCVTAFAQTPVSDWATVKSLAPGIQLRVASDASSKPIQGKLDAVTDNDLVLKGEAGSQTIMRSQIVSVSIPKQRHRLRNTMIGLGAGAGAGFWIGYGVGHAQTAHCEKTAGWFCGLQTGADAGIGGVGGLIGGTLVGFFVSRGGWRDVYVK